MYKIIAQDGNARLGELTTKTGKYQTPFFMPVATKGAVKYITTENLEEMETYALIANSFLIYLKPGVEIINKHGGLHNFMNWKGCIFTDSGGFQVLSMNDFKANSIPSGKTFHPISVIL